MEIKYTSHFVKHFRKLPTNIKKKACQKEQLFKYNPYLASLNTHKLSGKLKRYYAFSIDYQYRIIFAFEQDGSVTFIEIGSHSIYI